LPIFYCPNDKNTIELKFLDTLKKRNLTPSSNYKVQLDKLFQNGTIQKKLVDGQKQAQMQWNQINCLLSFSKTARDTVMWAHYAKRHKGIVIGIDFDIFFSKNHSLQMDAVNYSSKRPKINILEEPTGRISPDAIDRILMTKSLSWEYEQEFRTFICNKDLDILKNDDLACYKDFKGKNTWFLRLNPSSIKEIVFGISTLDNIKSSVQNLVKKPELNHITLYKAEESETYDFNLAEVT
jgi:hypothetical protein